MLDLAVHRRRIACGGIEVGPVDVRRGDLVGEVDELGLASELRGRDMSLCVDLVLNHTAREHPWARGWIEGDPEYADFYYAYPDRTMPDAYEATVNDVFPDQAPGEPWAYGTDGIGYNVQAVQKALGANAPVDSWSLVFDPANL